MYLLGIGLVLLLLKWQEYGPVANWAWWTVLAPFGLAVLWWAWADATGYSKRRAVEHDDARKQARIDKSKAAMGIGPRRPR